MKKINKRDILEGIGFVLMVLSIVTIVLVARETYQLRSEVKDLLKITNRK
jgi:hypothetical protein